MGYDHTDFPELEQRWHHVMMSPHNYANITTATTTVVKQSKGVLKGINVNKAVAGGSITVYDNSAGSGATIATIAFPSLNLLESLIPIDFNVIFSTGLTIVTVGIMDITVIYR